MSNTTDQMSAAELLAYTSQKASPAKTKPDSMSAADFQKQNRKKGDPEHLMQCEIVDDFRAVYPEFSGLLHSIPNGGKLPYHKNEKGIYTSPQRIKLVREGMLNGIPDLFLPVARGGWHGLYMELKILPNQPSEEQVMRMDLLMKQGFLCTVCYTRETGALFFKNYLELPPYEHQSA